MSTSELQIGDWINWWHPRKNAYIPMHISSFSMLSTLNNNEIIPVEITPDILERNSFNPIYEDKSCYKISNINTGYIIVIDLSCPKCSYVHNENDRIRFEGEILCVHDLQHILKLCKINIDIKI